MCSEKHLIQKMGMREERQGEENEEGGNEERKEGREEYGEEGRKG